MASVSDSSLKADLGDGQQVEIDAANLKFGFGKAVDEQTFKNRYAAQGMPAPNVVSLHDLARLRLHARLKAMKAARRLNKP